jgi:hypothetical protein
MALYLVLEDFDGSVSFAVTGVAGGLYAYGQVTYGASPRCQNTLIFSQAAQVHTSVA